MHCVVEFSVADNFFVYKYFGLKIGIFLSPKLKSTNGKVSLHGLE